MFILYFYKFYKNLSLNFFLNKTWSIKLNKKKNLFFKKKDSKKVLISKRLSIVLKKRKKIRQFKMKKIDKGNFFFKKFFFKTLLRNRKFFKGFFFLNTKVRQSKITKLISSNSKCISTCKNTTHEYSLLNILLRGHFFFFLKDVTNFLKKGFVYLNGSTIKNYNIVVNEGDCVQLTICKKYYKYLQFSRKILKKKINIFRFNSWKFFKQRFFKKKQNLKFKKRKNPNFLYLFYLYKLNVPRYLEVDYLTLTIFFIKKQNIYIQSSYYLNKLFSFKLFSLYNFKKIN